MRWALSREDRPPVYNEPALVTLRRSYFVFALAVLVAAFLALHPYLDAAGLCDLGGCPEASQSSSHAAHGMGTSATCLAAVLVASGAAALAFASLLGRRRVADQHRPAEAYLSPDTPPPQILPSF